LPPQGRVAYWADWRLLGLDKEQWGAVHINLGFLFIAILFVHIYYNWRPIFNYLKNKRKQFKLLTPNFVAAVVVVLVVAVGTLLQVPPLQSVIDLNTDIKDGAARTLGEPPYGHAELSSLKVFVAKVEADLPTALERLRHAGYVVLDPGLSLKEIAASNGVSPQQLYLEMVPASGGEAEIMPESPSSGTGTLPLSEICVRYGLDMQMVLHDLGNAGIIATADQSLKDIAEQYGKSPVDIYFLIHSTAVKSFKK
jgi:hypothetical protein